MSIEKSRKNFIRFRLNNSSGDWQAVYPEDDEAVVREIYDHIRLPKRATAGSAGYDFFLPVAITLNPDETLLIPTGIRAEITQGWVLAIFPRSSLGFKHRIQLDNTVGIIDSDYFGADNEGHIKIKITNDSKDFSIADVDEGKGFAQGIFLPFGITDDDSSDSTRTGGFGSTDK